MTDVERINAIMDRAWLEGEDTLTPDERARLDAAWRRECEEAEATARDVEVWR